LGHPQGHFAAARDEGVIFDPYSQQLGENSEIERGDFRCMTRNQCP
jgi:hypothetical protein